VIEVRAGLPHLSLSSDPFEFLVDPRETFSGAREFEGMNLFVREGHPIAVLHCSWGLYYAPIKSNLLQNKSILIQTSSQSDWM